MFKNNYIHEIELNISNACLANCIFCSREHGVGNIPFMSPNIFNELIKQLRDVKFDLIHTSGDGETFLNEHYIDYIRTLKKEFPNIPRHIYNNFSLFNKEKSDIIVNENLFEKVHTRVDSLHKWIFQRSSNLNQDIVFKNIKYFLSINKTIDFVILYNNIKKYYDRCKAIIGKRPIRDYFTDEELSRVSDEMNDINPYFSKFTENPDLIIPCDISPCLWGERRQAPKDETAKCPKINIIKNVIWIYPNGDFAPCCYLDTQDIHILGNVMTDHILDIFYGEKRKQFIEDTINRKNKEYPCNNPKCCGFGTDEDHSIESK